MRGSKIMVGALVAMLACNPASQDPPPRDTPRSAEAEPAPATTDTEGDAQEEADPERAHRVVFADRTSMGYLLLLPAKDRPETPTRDSLEKMVDAAFPGKPSEEVALLKTLIHVEPHDTSANQAADPDRPEGLQDTRPEQARGNDLLGLHVDVLPIGVGDEALVPALAYEDPVLLRELEPEQVKQMRAARWALLLRADYRNRHQVRGLRLLQALVRIAAKDRHALIFDPDTLETLDEEAFARRRLTSDLSHVADQVVVIPFADRRHGKGYVRVTTRGMRRFGSPEIELDGLPPEEEVVQRATELLHGIARVLVEVAEIDESGLAIELDEEFDVEIGDAIAAYAGRDYEPPVCDLACAGVAQLHLVRRPAEPQDPRELPVVRVVAPRAVSDAPGYDHPKWVQSALADYFGNSP